MRWMQVRLRPRSSFTPVVLATLTLLAAGPAAASANVGHRDQAFTASAVVKPSGTKPQSKLWYAHGAWWGSLFDRRSQAYHVQRFDARRQRWRDTGAQLDDRNSSHADTLYDGRHLYVASAPDETSASRDIRILRLKYRSRKRVWSQDALAQTLPTTAPVEAVVIDEDATGRLWLTYTEDNADGASRTVYVAHTSGHPGDRWSPAYALPVAGAADLTADDISAVVAYKGHVGVMWSNQRESAIFFAAHANGTGDAAGDWSLGTALSGPFLADDHINLKSVQRAGGQVFATVKTSNSDKLPPTPSDAQILLLRRSSGGSWSSTPFGTVGDGHTRPIVETDQRTNRLYVFATSPTVDTEGVQSIYYKATSITRPRFKPGLGTPFIRSSAGADVNDATSTKQDLGSLPNLLVLASDPTHYWHNTLGLKHRR